MKVFERRYHATWVSENGPSPLARLAQWICDQKGGRRDETAVVDLTEAPEDLLRAAAADVARRLPRVATREPTRRHRRHFSWLLGWRLRLGATRSPIPRPRRRWVVDANDIMVAADALELRGDLDASTRLRLALLPRGVELQVELGAFMDAEGRVRGTR